MGECPMSRIKCLNIDRKQMQFKKIARKAFAFQFINHTTQRKTQHIDIILKLKMPKLTPGCFPFMSFVLLTLQISTHTPRSFPKF